MELRGKKVLVYGSGISGLGASKLLVAQKVPVILYDESENRKIEDIQDKLQEDAVEIIVGEFPSEIIDTIGLVVLSPGVPTDLPMILKMKDSGITIWGEIELAYHYGKGEVLAITGTNGKTTTTSLLGEIMTAYRAETYVVGNIGNPYTNIALDTTDQSIIVAEMSSFQLETIEKFSPRISAILNITPDHLNRHHTMKAYIDAKKCIAINQHEDQICVLNYEDEVTRAFGEEIDAQVLYFSSKRKLPKGIYLDGDHIIFKNPEEVVVCNVHDLNILGVHNYENVMAAAAMAIAYGVSMDIVRDVICTFKGVEHRIEFVGEYEGVTYYNDSKGTNPDAAIKGIQAMNRPTILIGGGYDKDSEYKEWIESFQGRVKTLVLTGQTRFKIETAAKACGFDQVLLIEDFQQAVKKSAELANPGDAVLLSPACASWDMFESYEQRGDIFKEVVNNLEG